MIVEVATDTRKMFFRYSRLCGKVYEAVDTATLAITLGWIWS